ncbi:MAG: hypothetical protein KAJ91_00885 [Candidatus Aenigmarchaeota archaeon]|nr:hypothetical protein [Candidatus Aenigmarchaeota archaeon]MCK5334336.1 hypothetical protein [Candidatus Aenigmarchaeota archaeon]
MALPLHPKKASVSPIPLSIIALLISMIFLLAMYYLVSGGMGALSHLVMDLHSCITNPASCVMGIGA